MVGVGVHGLIELGRPADTRRAAGDVRVGHAEPGPIQGAMHVQPRLPGLGGGRGDRRSVGPATGPILAARRLRIVPAKGFPDEERAADQTRQCSTGRWEKPTRIRKAGRLAVRAGKYLIR